MYLEASISSLLTGFPKAVNWVDLSWSDAVDLTGLNWHELMWYCVAWAIMLLCCYAACWVDAMRPGLPVDSFPITHLSNADTHSVMLANADKYEYWGEWPMQKLLCWCWQAVCSQQVLTTKCWQESLGICPLSAADALCHNTLPGFFTLGVCWLYRYRTHSRVGLPLMLPYQQPSGVGNRIFCSSPIGQTLWWNSVCTRGSCQQQMFIFSNLRISEQSTFPLNSQTIRNAFLSNAISIFYYDFCSLKIRPYLPCTYICAIWANKMFTIDHKSF